MNPPEKQGKKQAAYARGRAAERIAGAYLERRGYRILAERYKTREGEIDLIAEKDGGLVFAEVKAHSDPEQALYAVGPRTRRRIEGAALRYLAEHPQRADGDMRFDVLVVEAGPGEWAGAQPESDSGDYRVRHLDNAWLAGQ